MKNSYVFKSRWMALVWAAGIIWFAYDLANRIRKDQMRRPMRSRQRTDRCASHNRRCQIKFAGEINSFRAAPPHSIRSICQRRCASVEPGTSLTRREAIARSVHGLPHDSRRRGRFGHGDEDRACGTFHVARIANLQVHFRTELPVNVQTNGRIPPKLLGFAERPSTMSAP